MERSARVSLLLFASATACGGALAVPRADGGPAATASGGRESIGGSDVDSGPAGDASSPPAVVVSGPPTDGGDAMAAVQGTLEGQPLPARSVVALPLPGGQGQIPSQALVGILNNDHATCDFLGTAASRHTLFANEISLSFTVQTYASASASSGPGGPLTAGVYRVGAGATGTYFSVDADCGDRVTMSASTGSVTISAIDAATIAGSFDLTFSDGDHVTGGFTAPLCAQISQASVDLNVSCSP